VWNRDDPGGRISRTNTIKRTTDEITLTDLNEGRRGSRVHFSDSHWNDKGKEETREGIKALIRFESVKRSHPTANTV
jgi:hypothetical protein